MDITPFLHDNPDVSIDTDKVMKKYEKDLITNNLAPAMLKKLSKHKKRTKSKAKETTQSMAENLNGTIGSLDSSMKGQYIDSAKDEVSQIINEIKNFGG
ncbi:hypothetical protein ACWCL1_07445 [Ligilactobacillus sp. LYQ135]